MNAKNVLLCNMKFLNLWQTANKYEYVMLEIL